LAGSVNRNGEFPCEARPFKQSRNFPLAAGDPALGCDAAREIVRLQQQIAERLLPNVLLELCRCDGEARKAIAARYKQLERFLCVGLCRPLAGAHRRAPAFFDPLAAGGRYFAGRGGAD
jgi:hypothetical protein